MTQLLLPGVSGNRVWVSGRSQRGGRAVQRDTEERQRRHVQDGGI